MSIIRIVLILSLLNQLFPAALWGEALDTFASSSAKTAPSIYRSVPDSASVKTKKEAYLENLQILKTTLSNRSERKKLTDFYQNVKDKLTLSEPFQKNGKTYLSARFQSQSWLFGLKTSSQANQLIAKTPALPASRNMLRAVLLSQDFFNMRPVAGFFANSSVYENETVPPDLEDSIPNPETALSALSRVRLSVAQNAFELDFKASFAFTQASIYSMRMLERFSQGVWQTATFLSAAQMTEEESIREALKSSLQKFYGDLAGISIASQELKQLVVKHFSLWINEKDIEDTSLSIDSFVERALTIPYTVLFLEDDHSNSALLEALARRDVKVVPLYCQPWNTPAQILGGKVPLDHSDRLGWGDGLLTQLIKEAKSKPEESFIFLIRNLEAMPSGVRMVLQEIVRTRIIKNNPQLGTVVLPPNLKIWITQNKTANLEDISSLDRVVVKSLIKGPEQSPEEAYNKISPIIKEEKQQSKKLVSKSLEGQLGILQEGNQFYLRLKDNVEIPLAEEIFGDSDSDITEAQIIDRVYEKTGLVLEESTQKMLSAMQKTEDSGIGMVRLEGATGIGKTFTGSGFAKLTGRGFTGNPISQGSELSNLNGSFEQDEEGNFFYQKFTEFVKRLETGDVVALSELNTLLDENEKVALAWWLLQIAETPRDAHGYKTIPISEVPVVGIPLSIRIHPRSLIIIDTNPEGAYSARGRFAEIFKEKVPVYKIDDFISSGKETSPFGFFDPDLKLKVKEIEKILVYIDQFVKHDWKIQGHTMAQAADFNKWDRKLIAKIFWQLIVTAEHEKISQRANVIFSIRELKRITEDLLWWHQTSNAKVSFNEAFTQSVETHLIGRIRNTEDQSLLRILKSGEEKNREEDEQEPPIDLVAFLSEQVLQKHRAVNVQITPRTDFRLELEAFKKKNPDVETVVISVTPSLRRFNLEGGMGLKEDGQLALLDGILGRYAEQAQQGKKIVLFFENAQNLKPEEAVALNETLQRREFYIKNRLKKTLPLNLGIVLIGRADYGWSPAELSRYVTLYYDQTPKTIKTTFSAPGLNQELASYGMQLLFDFYEELTQFLAPHPQYLERVSFYQLRQIFLSWSTWAKEVSSPELVLKKIKDLFVTTFVLGLPIDTQELQIKLTQMVEGMSFHILKDPLIERIRAFDKQKNDENRINLLQYVRNFHEETWSLVSREKDLSQYSIIQGYEEVKVKTGVGYSKKLAISANGETLLVKNHDMTIEIFEHGVNEGFWTEHEISSLDNVIFKINDQGDIIVILNNTNKKLILMKRIIPGEWASQEFNELKLTFNSLDHTYIDIQADKVLIDQENSRPLIFQNRDNKWELMQEDEKHPMYAHKYSSGKHTTTLSEDGKYLFQMDPSYGSTYPIAIYSAVENSWQFRFNHDLHDHISDIYFVDGQQLAVASDIRKTIKFYSFSDNQLIQNDMVQIATENKSPKIKLIKTNRDGDILLGVDDYFQRYKKINNQWQMIHEFSIPRGSYFNVNSDLSQIFVLEDTNVHAGNWSNAILYKKYPDPYRVDLNNNLPPPTDNSPFYPSKFWVFDPNLSITQPWSNFLRFPLKREKIGKALLLKMGLAFDKNEVALETVKGDSLAPKDIFQRGYRIEQKLAIHGNNLIGAVRLSKNEMLLYRDCFKTRIFKRENNLWREDSNAPSLFDGCSFLQMSRDKQRVFKQDFSRRLTVWNLESGKWEEDSFRLSHLIGLLAVNSEGTIIVEGDGMIFRTYSLKNGQWKQMDEKKVSHGGSDAVTLSQSNQLFIGRRDGTVKIYEWEQRLILANRWKRVAELKVSPDHSIKALQVSNDNKTMVVVDNAGVIRIYRHQEKWKLIHTYATGKDIGTECQLLISSDGKRFVMGAKYNRNIYFFNEVKDGVIETEIIEQVKGQSYHILSYDEETQEIITTDLRNLYFYRPESWMVGNHGNAISFSRPNERLRTTDFKDKYVQKAKITLEEKEENFENTQEMEPEDFIPRYGNKPFYFERNTSDRNIYLNYLGKRYLTNHQLKNPNQVKESKAEIWQPLALQDVKHPSKNRAFQPSDFLMETDTLKKIESQVFELLQLFPGVNLEGPPGAGKTSLSKEIALLLGQHAEVFLMHGERELSDFIGSYREDVDGKLILTSVPDNKGHFKLPLLEAMAKGHFFIIDEGAVGEKAKALLSWLSAVVQGEKEITIEEFPGQQIKIPVHPKFRFTITNNAAGVTAGRLPLPVEIAAHLPLIHVPEDDGWEVLKRLVEYYGIPELSKEEKKESEDTTRYMSREELEEFMLKNLFIAITGKNIADEKKQIAVDLDHLKTLSGQAAEAHILLKKLFEDIKDKDISYVSKREIRRLTGLFNSNLGDPFYQLYRGLRIVYEAMFPLKPEREKVLGVIEKIFEKEAEEFNARFRKEIHSRVGELPTEEQARSLFLLEQLLDRKEPVLFLPELGSDTSPIIVQAALKRHAKIVAIDADKEQRKLHILGGLFPFLKEDEKPSNGKNLHFVRGILTQYLLTRKEQQEDLKRLPPQQETILWVRNIEQWPEEIRTALNGLLEGDPLLLENEQGEVVEYFWPPHLQIVSEMTYGSKNEFSSAFFNRFIKIGLSKDSIEGLGESTDSKDASAAAKLTDFEKVLIEREGLSSQAAFYLAKVYQKLLEMDQKKLWEDGQSYYVTPSIFYMTAQAIRIRQQQKDWQELLRQISSQKNTQTPELTDQYEKLLKQTLIEELLAVVGARFKNTKRKSGVSDSDHFVEILRTVFDQEKIEAAPILKRSRRGGRIMRAGSFPFPTKVTPENVSKEGKMTYTQPAIKTLNAVARAIRLNKAIALAGDTGAAKTKLTQHVADLLGYDYFVYSAHKNSRVSDLSIDLDPNEDGSYSKKIQELYRKLKNGNLVIAIDEANAAPHVLEILNSLIRGEKWIHPVFPEEKPFKIGENVVLFYTFNPEHYSGRLPIPQRMLDRMVQVWMDEPQGLDRQIISGMFYGLSKEAVLGHLKTESALDLEEKTTPLIEEQIEFPEQENGYHYLKTPGEEDQPKQTSHQMDRLMRVGKETWDENEPAPSPEEKKESALDKKPAAYGVFTPELYPHTRYKSYNRFGSNGNSEIDSKGYQAVPLRSDLSNPQAESALSATHDLFTGRYRIDSLDNQWHSIPSAGAVMELLNYQVRDLSGNLIHNIELEFSKDDADNYYVRSKNAGSQSVIVEYRVAVEKIYFGRNAFATPQFKMPRDLDPDTKTALQEIVKHLQAQDKWKDLDLTKVSFWAALDALVYYFSDFSLKENGIQNTGNLYLDLVRSRCGVCRHRAWAFARTLQGLGISVRYLESQEHAWAEVKMPDDHWLRVDLGGGGDPRNMDLSRLAQERHQPQINNSFTRSEQFEKIGEQFAKRMEDAMQEQGLQPQYNHNDQPLTSEEKGRGGQFRSAESKRIDETFKEMEQKIELSAKEEDDLNNYLRKVPNAQEIFTRILEGIRSKKIPIEELREQGIEPDPVAFAMKETRRFINRKEQARLQKTAVSVLMDFSASMGSLRDPLMATIASVGVNFHQLREELPSHFYFDLSHFTHSSPTTEVSFLSRKSKEELKATLLGMNPKIASGGTNLLLALQEKLKDFTDTPEIANTKIKYLILFTDGADSSITGNPPEPTPELKTVLDQYHNAGVEIFAVGIGYSGCKDVVAFDGPGLHHIFVDDKRPQDIATAVAGISERVLTSGLWTLPPGDITTEIGLPKMEKNLRFALWPWLTQFLRKLNWTEESIFNLQPLIENRFLQTMFVQFLPKYGYSQTLEMLSHWFAAQHGNITDVLYQQFYTLARKILLLPLRAADQFHRDFNARQRRDEAKSYLPNRPFAQTKNLTEWQLPELSPVRYPRPSDFNKSA